MASRVLVLGLDSLDERILDEAVEAEWMPAVGEILARSVRGATEWPRPLGTGALWPTIWTATGPFRHQVPFWGEVPDRRESMSSAVEPFYVRLARDGYRVALVDVPYAPAGEGYLHVSDWLTHDRKTAPIATGTVGDVTAADVTARLADDHWCRCDDVERTKAIHEALAERLTARVRRQTDAVLHVLRATDVDLLASVFAATHCAIHHLWADSPAGPGALESVLRAVDRAVAELVDAAGPDASVVLLSGHGARLRTTGSYFMEDFLERAFARLPTPLRVRAGRSSWELVKAGRDSRRAWRRVPFHEFAGAIRIRRRGRDSKRGVGERDAERLIDALVEAARALRDLDTGERAVTDIVITSERWPDEDTSTWPDVFLVWNEATPLDRVGSPTLGELEGERWGHRSGDHRALGFVSIAADLTPRRLEGPVALVDIAPTVALLLGAALEDVDGSSLVEPVSV